MIFTLGGPMMWPGAQRGLGLREIGARSSAHAMPDGTAMNFSPLLDAAPAIPVHAFAAMAAFALGLVQFAAPKGTLPHRTLGWIWVALMALVAQRALGSGELHEPEGK